MEHPVYQNEFLKKKKKLPDKCPYDPEDDGLAPLAAAAFKSCIEVGECLIKLAKSNSEYPGEADKALFRLDRFNPAGSAAKAAEACRRLR